MRFEHNIIGIIHFDIHLEIFFINFEDLKGQNVFKNDPQTVGELTMVSVGYEGKSSGKTSSFGGSAGSKNVSNFVSE